MATNSFAKILNYPFKTKEEKKKEEHIMHTRHKPALHVREFLVGFDSHIHNSFSSYSDSLHSV